MGKRQIGRRQGSVGLRVHLLVYLVPAATFGQVAALTCLVYQREPVESTHHPPITCVHHALRRITLTCT